MKKILAHPVFYYLFALLGLGAMGLQFWYLQVGADSKGLLRQHPAAIATWVLLACALVFTFLLARYTRIPNFSKGVRAGGAALAAIFTAIGAGVFAYRENYLLFVLCALSAVSAVYILWAYSAGKKPHYAAYSLFAVCFMFYLISRYQAWSAEPEITRYVYKILALVCMMMVFYQQSAIRAGKGRFCSYFFWHGMTLFLSLTAVPSSANPALYLAAALWLLVDPAPRPAEGSGGK